VAFRKWGTRKTLSFFVFNLWKIVVFTFEKKTLEISAISIYNAFVKKLDSHCYGKRSPMNERLLFWFE